MNAELDHLFVMCAANAPEAAALAQLGFEEGSANTHPGQGTACRRFFFRNSYLELLWVHTPDEVRSERVRRTGLWERWSGRESGLCPFGVVMRPASAAPDVEPPFRAWSYEPAYLPAGLAIRVASDVPFTEPAFFWLPFRRGARPPAEPMAHRLGKTITGVSIGIPGEGPRSEPARVVEALALLAFETRDEHLLELTLDGGRLGAEADLRGTLPIRLRW